MLAVQRENTTNPTMATCRKKKKNNGKRNRGNNLDRTFRG